MSRSATAITIAAIAFAGASGVSLYRSEQRALTIEATLSQLQERTYAIAVELAQMRQAPAARAKSDPAIEEALAWLRDKPIANLAVSKIDGLAVKTQPFTLNPSADPMRLRSIRAPDGWTPKPDSVEASLPFAWPANYVEKWNQPFNADTLMFNCAALANWLRDGGEKELARPYLKLLLDRLDQFTIPTSNGGTAVVYKFDYSFHDQPLPSGWRSAYANGSALAGLIYLAKALPDADLTSRADRLFRGLLSIEGQSSPWLSTVDERQFLWLEEYPLDGPRKAHVFNGHVWAAFALSEYHFATGNTDARTAAVAAITTAKRYFGNFRYPGKVSRYDLYAPYNPDYAPYNIIRQQRALHALTGDPAFGQFAAALMRDAAHRPPYDSTRSN